MQRRIKKIFNCSLLLIVLALINFSANGQSGDSIIAELKLIQQIVTNNDQMTISNRAMNIFLADKTGYLSANTDLSYYTNYLTLNSLTGGITVNHNFQKANGVDESIKKLFSAGVAVTLPVGFSNGFLDKRYDNGIGFLINYKWLGRVKTSFVNADQKKAMNALRAAQLYELETSLNNKITGFEKSIEKITETDIPGQEISSAKQMMRQNFWSKLREEYEEKFASLQAVTLTESNNFKTISTHWTSINSYLPVISPGYFVAGSVNTSFQHKHSYPLQLLLSHTRFWQSSTKGKLFITIGGGISLNNSKLSYGLAPVSLSEYILAGGTDTLHMKELKNNKAYIGDYKTFITLNIEGRMVYFPGNSHIGIGAVVQQHFGKYQSLNAKFSMPVILINHKKIPAVNFDFYVLFIDLNNKLTTSPALSTKTIAGISAGIPFSRLTY